MGKLKLNEKDKISLRHLGRLDDARLLADISLNGEHASSVSTDDLELGGPGISVWIISVSH